MPRPIPYELVEAGKRMADQINGRLAFHSPWELRDKWMAFRLQDGTTDGAIYDSMSDAKRFTDEWKCFYFTFLNCLGGVTARDCSIILQFSREARDVNMAQKEPNSQAFLSIKGGDHYRQRLGG